MSTPSGMTASRIRTRGSPPRRSCRIVGVVIRRGPDHLEDGVEVQIKGVVRLEGADQELTEPFEGPLRAERVRDAAEGVSVTAAMPPRPRVSQVGRAGGEDQTAPAGRVEFRSGNDSSVTRRSVRAGRSFAVAFAKYRPACRHSPHCARARRASPTCRAMKRAFRNSRPATCRPMSPSAPRPPPGRRLHVAVVVVQQAQRVHATLTSAMQCEIILSTGRKPAAAKPETGEENSTANRKDTGGVRCFGANAEASRHFSGRISIEKGKSKKSEYLSRMIFDVRPHVRDGVCDTVTCIVAIARFRLEKQAIAACHDSVTGKRSPLSPEGGRRGQPVAIREGDAADGHHAEQHDVRPVDRVVSREWSRTPRPPVASSNAAGSWTPRCPQNRSRCVASAGGIRPAGRWRGSHVASPSLGRPHSTSAGSPLNRVTGRPTIGSGSTPAIRAGRFDRHRTYRIVAGRLT